MTKTELVDGDGWISDESSFYGDETVCSRLELEAERQLNIPYFPFAHIVRKRKAIAARSQPREVQHGAATEGKASIPSSTGSKDVQTTKKDFMTFNGAQAAGSLESTKLKGNSASWQLDESIDAFLDRHPVADPKTARVGPWLWVPHPDLSESVQARRDEEDVQAFVSQATKLLRAFDEERGKSGGNDQSRTKPTRHMRMRRDKLEEDLLAVAIRYSTTCGKWMLFPGPEDLERYWRMVAEGTAAGRFGPVSKVATPEFSSTKEETLICVYTYDFSDLNDVRRVLNELRDCGLCAGSKPIYYKPDAYTYLDITSGNSYDLRASLFSSKEMFANNARLLDDGPIERAKQRNGQKVGAAP